MKACHQDMCPQGAPLQLWSIARPIVISYRAIVEMRLSDAFKRNAVVMNISTHSACPKVWAYFWVFCFAASCTISSPTMTVWWGFCFTSSALELLCRDGLLHTQSCHCNTCQEGQRREFSSTTQRLETAKSLHSLDASSWAFMLPKWLSQQTYVIWWEQVGSTCWCRMLTKLLCILQAEYTVFSQAVPFVHSPNFVDLLSDPSLLQPVQCLSTVYLTEGNPDVVTPRDVVKAYQWVIWICIFTVTSSTWLAFSSTKHRGKRHIGKRLVILLAAVSIDTSACWLW